MRRVVGQRNLVDFVALGVGRLFHSSWTVNSSRRAEYGRHDAQHRSRAMLGPIAIDLLVASQRVLVEVV